MMKEFLSNTRVSGGGASPVANTKAAVDTVMQGLTTAYEHYTGTRNSDTFGDLQWLTLDTLKKSSKTTRLRPLFGSSVNPAASPHQQDPLADSTLKKNLDNFRSVLCAAKKYIKSREMDDTALISHYDTAFDAFGSGVGDGVGGGRGGGGVGRARGAARAGLPCWARAAARAGARVAAARGASRREAHPLTQLRRSCRGAC